MLLREHPFALQVPQALCAEDLFAAKSKWGANAFNRFQTRQRAAIQSA